MHPVIHWNIELWLGLSGMAQALVVAARLKLALLVLRWRPRFRVLLGPMILFVCSFILALWSQTEVISRLTSVDATVDTQQGTRAQP